MIDETIKCVEGDIKPCNDGREGGEITRVSSNTFDMQLGRTKYIVNVHFDENSKETYADKVKRLIVNDCMKKI